MKVGRRAAADVELTVSNTFFNGRPWHDSSCEWADCDWGKAWVDPGPSPAGNPGPYLKVRWSLDGEVLIARIYPKAKLWRKGMRIERDGDKWMIRYTPTGPGKGQTFPSPTGPPSARR